MTEYTFQSSFREWETDWIGEMKKQFIYYLVMMMHDDQSSVCVVNEEH